MAPPLLHLKDTHLTFGTTPLLEGAEMAVHAGERICVVGRNGSGKSTFLKIAAGQIEPDKGERFFQPGTTLRYLPQEPDLSAYATIADYVSGGLEGADDYYRIPYLLDALGLDGANGTSHLSGGETRRAALARALAPEPDILMLDEPTNHLDLPAIEWLEGELGATRSALVLISHDRRFASALSRKTLWVDRGQTRLLDKGFGEFEDWRDNFIEQEELDQHKLDRQIAREQHWIVHGVSGRRKRNVRRVKELADLRQSRTDHRSVQGASNITVSTGQRSGKSVVRMERVSKSFGDRMIVDSLDLKIARGDRLGIIGPNGSGKTTLLKLIMGGLEPDSGKITRGVNLEPLVIDQRRETLKDEWSLSEALTDGGGNHVIVDGESRHVVGYMKDFLFAPEQARTSVTRLSGGERARLILARGLRLPSNLLVLDEPTNDLDLETLDLLQEMVADYDGTVIIVSHDRDFLDRTVTSVLASDPGGQGRWTEYAGGYSDMLAQGGQNVSSRREEKTASSKSAAPAIKTEPKKVQKLTPKKLSYKYEHRAKELPKEMKKLQANIKSAQAKLDDGGLFARDPEAFNGAIKALEKAKKGLLDAEDEWLEIEMMREG
ncbi:ABC-F family ATP-binding cassette domain-containing protein [Robiginitomaculum antarcticum]|uniref:ABC-F family ATP-binding cassette domain-containing protein n=1 Tax=Robiginitomaculum antarcticum TaxID=437507 RepID=UPI000368ADFD|nr:ATP-binding cassette domain-containing protein [Robiginitomaculum antarcticum]